jgi:hypothetical protein
MAQEQKFAVPGGFLVKDATGTYRMVREGEQDGLKQGPPQLPFAPMGEKSNEPANATGRDFALMGAQALTLGAGFIPGGQPVALGGLSATIPWAIPAVMGAGALQGAIDPNATAGGEALYQGALEGATRGVSKVIPPVANRLGLMLGGLSKGARGQIGDFADAFARQKERMTPGNPLSYFYNILRGNIAESTGVPIGSQNTTRRLMNDVGRKIEDFGNSRPERIDLFDLSGATDDLSADAINFPGVSKTRSGLASGETNEILDQTQQRWIDAGRPPGPVDTTISFRESQKLRAGYGSHAQSAFERSTTPGFDSVAEETSSKMWAAMNQRLRELQEAALAGDQQALATIKRFNQEFADLANMHKANASLRGGGGVFGDIGQLSVRGGLGGALGMGAAHQAGLDYRQGGLWGGLLGILGLNPRAISMAGNVSADVARAAPTITRAADMASEDKPPRRRTPGGRR